MNHIQLLDNSLYLNEDVTDVARSLLGTYIISRKGGVLTSGMIVETEAYSGRNDKACHANNQKLTQRNAVMFEKGGLAYVYLCYGIHHLFNVVCNVKGMADAVLIRAIEPILGLEEIKRRRNPKSIGKGKTKMLTNGPGKLAQALKITVNDNAASLSNGKLIIAHSYNKEHPEMKLKSEEIVSTTRIGVDYAGEDALKKWRYYIKGNEFVSRK